jgi:nitrate reductase gamma subunit
MDRIAPGRRDKKEGSGQLVDWLEWARGPIFRLSIALMILGLLRLAVLNAANILSVLSHTRNKNIPWRTVLRDTARWLLPYKAARPHMVFTVASFLFHVSAIVTPIFLAAHIALWQRGTGLSWAAIPQTLADYLTLLAIATAAILFFKRVSAKVTRALSRPQDYLLPLLIMAPFITGYLAMHPAINPFSYNATMFVHVMSGNVLLVLIPFSKLSHAVLFPTTQLVSEMAWHLAPNAGRSVALTLGKENEPI